MKEKPVIRAILAVVGGLLFIAAGAVVSNFVQSSLRGNEPVNPSNGEQREIIACSEDFTSYSTLVDTGKKVSLIQGKKSMFAEDGKFVNSEIVITKNETDKSKVACGYLFVKAGTDSGALRTWENLYINPNDFGGHISPKNQFGPGDGNNYSAYLFSLNKISYWKNLSDHARGVVSDADWAALLNVSKTVSFIVALNTEDKSGFIEEMSIAYKCWDPTTGKENSDCSLSVTKQSDTESASLK